MKFAHWQPIETAPTDGTVILLTDREHVAMGMRAFRIEDDWQYRGYDADNEKGETFLDRIPNPNAGLRHEWWQTFGCSGLSIYVQTEDYDGAVHFEPTHWMLIPAVSKVVE